MDNPAAWHPDPMGKHEHRWWDGQRWTEHVADAGQASIDPIDAGGGSSSAQDTGSAASTTSEQATNADTSEQTAQGWQQPGGAQAGSDWQQPGGAAGGPAGGGQPGWDQQSQQQWQQPQQQAPQWQQQPQQQWPQASAAAEAPAAGSAGMAIFALIMGILSLLFFWVPVLGGIGAIVAVIFGFLGRSAAKKRRIGGAGMGLAGIITGFVALAANILVSMLFFGAVSGGFGFFDVVQDFDECMQENNDEQFCEQQLEEDMFDRFGG